jgi:hypothetical protein
MNFPELHEEVLSTFYNVSQLGLETNPKELGCHLGIYIYIYLLLLFMINIIIIIIIIIIIFYDIIEISLTILTY